MRNKHGRQRVKQQQNKVGMGWTPVSQKWGPVWRWSSFPLWLPAGIKPASWSRFQSLTRSTEEVMSSLIPQNAPTLWFILLVMESNHSSWMTWKCPWYRLGKAFDFCPNPFQVYQYLNETNNPVFSERDEVVCLSPFGVVFQVGLTEWREHDLNANSSLAPPLSSGHLSSPSGLEIGSLTFNRQVLTLLFRRCTLQESQEIRAHYWLPEPTGVTVSPRSGAKMPLSAVALISCYLLPLSRHGKLALYSVFHQSWDRFHYTSGSCTLH